MLDMIRFRMKYRKFVVVLFVTVLLGLMGYYDNGWTAAPGLNTYINSSHGSNGEGLRPPGVNRAKTGTAVYDPRLATYATGNCAHCHEQHASINGDSPTNPASRYMIFDVEQDACFACHNGNPASDILSDFTLGGAFSIVTYHGLTSSIDYIKTINTQHVAHEKDRTDFGFSDPGNRHAECTDCHNPHTATAIDTSDTSLGPIIGSTGVFPSFRGGNWATPVWTDVFTEEIVDRLEQYKVCYKCHSNWAGVGTGTNLAQEFNVNNDAYHNIEGSANPPSSDTYGNFQITGNEWAYKMMPRYNNATNATLRNVQLICSDCHGNSDISPQGIHGSSVNHILKVPDNSPYTTWDEASDGTDGNVWCFNCHDPNFTNSGFSSGMANFHNNGKHDVNSTSSVFCMSCHTAVPHGYTNYRMLVCEDETAPGASSSFYIRGTRPGSFLLSQKTNWASSGGWTRTICHGTGSGAGGVTTCPP